MRWGLPLFCLCVLGTPAAARAATLYYCTAGEEEIYSVDTVTGGDALLMATPGMTLMDLSTSDQQDVIYGPDQENWLLVALDVAAQTLTEIGDLGAEIRGLAFDTTRGVLYGSDYSRLYIVDAATGQSTLIGSLGGPSLLWAMGFDPTTDTLYGVDSGDDRLYTIDTATGLATPVGDTGIDRITDVFVEPESGVLYAVTNGAAVGDIITTLDKGTGQARPTIGTLTSSRAVGLAAPPEPVLAVQYAGYRALEVGSGIRIEWSTLLEDATFGFEIQARAHEGASWKLPRFVNAAGSGSSYEVLDTSPEALNGNVTSYRVLELTLTGAGVATPWFEVTTSRGGRSRSPER